MSLPSSMADFVPCDRLLQKAYKVSTYKLRNRTSQYPKVNTDRFKNSYINRLIFKHNLAR